MYSEEEIEALHMEVHGERPPHTPPTLKEVVQMLGPLGGHLGRKGGGDPGVTVLWRGWLRLHDAVHLIELLRKRGLFEFS